MPGNNEAMTNVPEDRVGTIVQQYIDWDDAREVQCQKENDGTWKIVAH